MPAYSDYVNPNKALAMLRKDYKINTLEIPILKEWTAAAEALAHTRGTEDFWSACPDLISQFYLETGRLLGHLKAYSDREKEVKRLIDAGEMAEGLSLLTRYTTG